MTKNEYISQLTQALNRFSPTVRAEILEDYEAHFSAGLEAGRTEDEICRELGSIDHFIEELSQIESPSDSGTELVPTTASNSSDASPQDVTFQPKAATRLALSGLHAEVFLSASPDQQFHIYYECNGSLRQQLQYRFDWREDGDTIYARVKKVSAAKGFFSSFTAPSITVKAQIPPYMNSIKVETESGDINAKGLNGSCVFSTISGDINAEGSFNSCKLNSTSGDVECTSHSDCNFSVHTTSGDIVIYLYAAVSGTINTVSGDIEISLSDSAAGCSIDYTTVSGDFEVNCRCTSNQRRHRNGHAEIPGNGNHKLALATTSGDITIN